MATATFPYIPTQQTTDAFWAQQTRLQEMSSPRVPLGFPERLQSPLAWTAKQAEERRAEWVLNLTADDIKSVEAASGEFECGQESNSLDFGGPER
jgi:hypothetical protein